MHQRLLIVRNGQPEHTTIRALRPGAAGNVQTLRIAAQMVREDAFDESLRWKTESLIADCTPHDAMCEVGKVFEFVRDQIRYVDDPPDAERLSDARSTLAAPAGDCLDKAVLLMSMLATVGYQSQFIVQSWDGDVSDDGFDHVHAEVLMPDGSWLEADPTERSGVLGWEKPGAARMRFTVWKQPAVSSRQKAGLDFSMAGMGGLFDNILPGLIQTGVQAGSQYVAGEVQQARLTSAQEKQIAAAFNQIAAQVVQVLQGISARLPNITTGDLATAQQLYQQVENWVQTNGTDYVRQLWTSPNYQGAFQSDLSRYQQALASQPAGAVAVGSIGSNAPGSVITIGSPQSGISVDGSWLLPGAIVIGLLIFVMGRR
jgi:Transglutaminase-like superfamily